MNLALDRLSERFWRSDSDPDFTETFFPEWRRKRDEPLLAYAAYLPAPTPVPVAASMRPALGNESTPAGGLLRAFLLFHRPQTLFEAAFLVDFFMARGAAWTGRAPDTDFPFDYVPLIDEVLVNSQGVLLWNFQLENLAVLAGLRRAETAEFRRGLNRKDLRSLELAERLYPAPNVSLLAVLEERMMCGVVVAPSLAGAGRLIAGV